MNGLAFFKRKKRGQAGEPASGYGRSKQSVQVSSWSGDELASSAGANIGSVEESIWVALILALTREFAFGK